MSAALLIMVLTLAALVLLWLPGTASVRLAGGVGRGAVGAVDPGAAEPAPGLVERAARLLPRSRSRAASEAAEWVDWVRQLAALIRAGQSSAAAFTISGQTAAQAPEPSAAVRRQAQVCRTVAQAASVGRSPASSLRDHARAAASTGRPTPTELAVITDLARCWEVSERTGAPLAALLDGLADAAESDLDAVAARETALAGARATVRILSWLPVLALGLGMLIGADPVRTLLTTPFGMVAALAGAVLTAAGRVWTHRMVRAAVRASSRRAPRDRRAATGEGTA